jgi:hypothetical protein
MVDDHVLILYYMSAMYDVSNALYVMATVVLVSFSFFYSLSLSLCNVNIPK